MTSNIFSSNGTNDRTSTSNYHTLSCSLAGCSLGVRCVLVLSVSFVCCTPQAAAFADPYTIITGGSGALCGLVGVLFVELFNMWSVVKEPVNELINLCIFFAVILLVGTMPHLNNWAHVAGFVFGLLMAMLLLPYVSFGKWGIRRKRILVVVSIILLLVFILSLILLFQIVQNTSCASCDRFNCIDYSPGLCARYRPTPPATAVQYSPNEARYYQNAIWEILFLLQTF